MCRVCSVTSEPSQSSSRGVSSFKDSSALLNERIGSLVTFHTLAFTHVTSVVKPVHIFMARSRVSKYV